jgi:hypothetical protein
MKKKKKKKNEEEEEDKKTENTSLGTRTSRRGQRGGCTTCATAPLKVTTARDPPSDVGTSSVAGPTARNARPSTRRRR